jgi:hypothetical protein
MRDVDLLLVSTRTQAVAIGGDELGEFGARPGGPAWPARSGRVAVDGEDHDVDVLAEVAV